MKQHGAEHMQAGRDYSVGTSGPLLPFLLEHAEGKSRNHMKSMLARGQVLVDGRRVTQFDRPLSPGQTVTVLRYAPKPSALPFPILFEDRELIAVNKPAGLLSIATEQEKEATAYHMVTDYVAAATPGTRVWVVHRLDRDTSGALLFAKNQALKLAFQENWSRLVKTRGYLAAVEGVPRERSGTVHTWLHETATHLVYSGRPEGGQEAVTRYRLLQEGGGFSLLEVELDTGRKNQIRAHMKELGHPVAGDKKYGASSNPMGRLGLHASRLALSHPLTGRELVFDAPIPKEFNRLFPGLPSSRPEP